MEDKSDIADFYRGKSVFITGGTGFLGKTITEKLLYSCPDIDKIYLLVREHKGFDLEKRFNLYFQDPLFQRLKNEKPESLRKVVPVLGDLVSDEFITSSKDVKTLIEKVSVVFHVAATISFNEPLKVAMSINVEGTKKILQLCRQMKQLKAVVHVSTAFIRPGGKDLEEKFYPVSMTSEDVYKKLNVENFTDEDEANILGACPNTYIFTKALSETIIAEQYKDLPLVIVRPSISAMITMIIDRERELKINKKHVTAMKGNPLPGWIDNWAGATALLYPIGKGFARVGLCNSDNLIDIIPVDFVSNCAIIAAPEAKREDMPIFNICTSSCNPLTLQRISDETVDVYVKNVLNDFPHPYVVFTESVFIEYIILNIMWILCYLGDLYCKARNKSARYVKSLSKLVAVNKILSFFVSRSWLMKCEATRSLYQSLAPTDRETFYCDPRTINWKSYMASYCLGIEKFLVNKTKNK